MMDKLKPCPFCGGEVRWCGDDPADKHECHEIHCDGCGAHFSCNPNELPEADTLEEEKDLQAKAWNQRDQETRIQGLVEGLEKYGQHLGGCNHYRMMPFSNKRRLEWESCTCGLSKILSAYKEGR